MLAAIGVESIDALFACVPDKLRLNRLLDLPAAASEQEVVRELSALAARNSHAEAQPWFLGGGIYAHYLPAAVHALASRAEFYTAYTPYQPEISQGTLQTIFEWQTMVCALTGLEVSNASLYDGASATAEAVLLAMRATRRERIVVAHGLHPHYGDVLRTYLRALAVDIEWLPRDPDGRSVPVAPAIDDATACVVVQSPSFLGPAQDLRAAAEAAHARGALLIVVVTEPLSLALFQAPGALGADVVCGEAQGFGVPMSLGGPALGFLATRDRFVRQLPGRLVGETVDTRGRRGYVLTLSTREQHIRREKATSNICTNQGLCLLYATIYLSLLGRVGLRKLARLNYAKAEYLKRRVRETPGLSLPLAAPGFNEFVVGVPDSAAAALARAREAGIVGGLDLAPYEPELGPALLVCATELASRASIDELVARLADVDGPVPGAAP
ncbi:aminomethyl-transferring glycine dehydrogenase subunit GcvPA [Myxococcota bacterium]|nr:aminomethyl-transferring glycine dehydrogenase subunit GcvPA [Myxococcota bacterium]MCZ7619628.1 aminomethyl-transferring glycine dehydrogenase subunit GcvPA [Myxococcota bacterium]